MALELYAISGSPYAWRVQLALEHKRVPHTVHMLSMSAGELATASYLALNPRGKVPTLVDDDFVLYESIAILAYLEQRWPDPPLFGRAPRETGTIWRVIAEYTAYLDPAVEAFILPLYFGRAAEKADAIRAAIPVIVAELDRHEAVLARSPYLTGDVLTAADIVVFPHVKSILRAAAKDAARAFELAFVPLATRYPAIDAWRARIEQLPGYARTVPPHWRAG